MEGHTTITSLHLDGEPKSLKGIKMIVVNQCGCYVRENIPISFKLWKKTKSTDNDAEIVPDPIIVVYSLSSCFLHNNACRGGSNVGAGGLEPPLPP